MKRTVYIALVMLVLSILYVATVKAQDSFMIYNNGTTTSSLTRVFKEAVDQGMGQTTMVKRDNSSGTVDVTYTYAPTPVKVAIRTQETAIADATIATGVVYFYWDTASAALRVKYRNATGTLLTGTISMN